MNAGDDEPERRTSDVSRPSALPSANLRLPGASALAPATSRAAEADQTSEQYLDAFEEDWNKRIDNELEVMVEGMMDLVSLAQVCVMESAVNPNLGLR
jgi:mediator of RNA polymerase II transcription subunit 22